MHYPVFPKGFIFGAATAAYQIEGAAGEDGRGLSIWDKFSHTEGKIRGGANGDVACDHYHKYKEDILLMKQLGLDAYRYSIAWSRIFPEGEGKINMKGLDFYSRLTDELLKKGIDPYVTLFHWDLPLALQEKYGGFRNRDVSSLYADYTETVVRHLGDRVTNWITINEPFEFAALGHLLGAHAPGTKSLFAYFEVMHNILRAHGLGLERIRSIDPKANAGITVSLTPIHPATPSQKDIRAAKLANQLLNGITLDPVFKGHYPEELWKAIRFLRPKVMEGDMQLISKPVDFVGFNNYQREFASYKWFVPLLHMDISGKDIAETEFVKDGVQHTSMGWEVYPEGIYECLKLLQNEYGNPPVFITENGAAFDDVILKDAKVHDPLRISFLDSYIKKAHQAVNEGANLKGYFAWSLMDNFEWAAGYTKRFGLIHIDYASQKRTVKDSGLWFRDLIKAQSSAKKTAAAVKKGTVKKAAKKKASKKRG